MKKTDHDRPVEPVPTQADDADDASPADGPLKGISALLGPERPTIYNWEAF